MRQQLKSRQRGISFFSLIMGMIVLALLFVVGAKVFPTAVEYSAVQKAVNRAARDGNTVQEVRASFDRAADVDNITSIKGSDLTVTKEGDQVVVTFAYEKEIALFGPAYLLLKYEGSSRLQTR